MRTRKDYADMKKLIALLLVCVFSLVGCIADEPETHANSMQENITENKNDEIKEDMSGNSDETIYIVDICDEAKEKQLVCEQALELFYEDDTAYYSFHCIKSQHIIVTYNNGNSEDIITAIQAGRASLADLDAFGIAYITEPKQ
ncbi:MAG: hypothetical protein IKM38_00730 [Christensenellaceae bacterium]|nr:hypothetical protein [Christensenellaceae bacterium]